MAIHVYSVLWWLMNLKVLPYLFYKIPRYSLFIYSSSFSLISQSLKIQWLDFHEIYYIVKSMVLVLIEYWVQYSINSNWVFKLNSNPSFKSNWNNIIKLSFQLFMFILVNIQTYCVQYSKCSKHAVLSVVT